MVVESGEAVTLGQGRAFHFADRFQGGEAPEGIARSSDGLYRITLGDARTPVLCAPAPYVVRQKLSLPMKARLRAGFGLAPGSWNKAGAGVRFLVRVKAGGKIATPLSREVRRWQGPDTANWNPAEFELPSGEVEVELATELVGAPRGDKPTDSVAAHALWVDPAVIVPPARGQPNIIVVLIDALRADHLGCYGYKRDTSPFLDSLAASGVLFEEANAQATWTMPSVESLLTSTYRFMRRSPAAGPVRTEAGEEGPSFRPVSMPASLQGELRKAGYETSACVGGGFLDPALGFEAGFGWYWSPRHTPMLPNQLSVVKDQLSRGGAGPFFFLLHTFEVHNYFQGWGHDIGLFDRGYLGPLTDPRRLMEAVLHRDPAELTAADRQYIEDLYDGEIHHADRYLGLFFQWLLAQPSSRNTIIVVIADHGEGLGEHGAISHGGAPYRSVARVPLIVYSADGRWGARRVRDPVALSDLMPTLLELAGASPPPSAVGASLVPLMRGEKQPPRPIFSECTGAALMARDARSWYLTYRGERSEELYDVANDPGQEHNIAGSSPAELARMRQVMAGFARQAARGYRLAVSGQRPEALTITLESASGLSYFDVPTRRPGQAVKTERVAPPSSRRRPGETGGRKQRVTVEIPAGGEQQVILFEPADPDAEVIVSARAGERAVAPDRFHLGAKGRGPEQPSIVIGAAGRALLTAEAPPAPEEPGVWGIWLWLPPAAAESLRPQALQPQELPEDLREQLKALGYLR
jgi:hypothetical protein